MSESDTADHSTAQLGYSTTELMPRLRRSALPVACRHMIHAQALSNESGGG
jgi:hypothetical protein